MTRDEAVARIAQGAHFREGDEDIIKGYLEEARVHLEQGKSLPWWLKEEDATLSLLAGENAITLPTGFIRVDKLEPLYYTGVEGVARNIPWRAWSDAQSAYQDRDDGGPLVAALRETSIYVFPAADVDYDLVWSYYKHSDPLNGADIAAHPWLVNCPDLIIGEAGERYAMDIDDASAVSKFQLMKSKGFSSMIAEIAERESTEGPLQIGANN